MQLFVFQCKSDSKLLDWLWHPISFPTVGFYFFFTKYVYEEVQTSGKKALLHFEVPSGTSRRNILENSKTKNRKCLIGNTQQLHNVVSRYT